MFCNEENLCRCMFEILGHWLLTSIELFPIKHLRLLSSPYSLYHPLYTSKITKSRCDQDRCFDESLIKAWPRSMFNVFVTSSDQDNLMKLCSFIYIIQFKKWTNIMNITSYNPSSSIYVYCIIYWIHSDTNLLPVCNAVGVLSRGSRHFSLLFGATIQTSW